MRNHRRQPTRQDRWRSTNMKGYFTRLTRAEAQRFDAACADWGVKPYRLLQKLALSWTEERERVQAAAAARAWR